MNTDLKALLRERGLKQRQLAVSLGVSEATISQWLAAIRSGQHKRIPAEQAKPLAKALGLRPRQIRPDLFGATVRAQPSAAEVVA